MTLWGWENYDRCPNIRAWAGAILFLGYYPFQEETIAERLLSYRRTHGLSGNELAQKLEVDPTTLGRWERGYEPKDARCIAAVDKLFEQGVE